MIIGFDIGNTSTSMGIYRGDGAAPEIIHRYGTVKKPTAHELADTVGRLLIADEISVTDISGVAMSSVVPELNDAYRKLTRRLFHLDLFEISEKRVMTITLGYTDPSQLGADRIANAEAAFHEYHGDCVVADMGTAVTFSVVDRDGRFEGGIIAPGAYTAIAALHTRASQLPEIPFEKPERLVARDTMNAIKAGIFYGWISLIEGITDAVEREYGRTFSLILTGGYSEVIAGSMHRPFIHDPLLVMKGIRLIYQRNAGTGQQ